RTSSRVPYFPCAVTTQTSMKSLILSKSPLHHHPGARATVATEVATVGPGPSGLFMIELAR
ncbi:MAG: hypothetical protein QXI60_08345, partial [Thermofilaceae archaeon]